MNASAGVRRSFSQSDAAGRNNGFTRVPSVRNIVRSVVATALRGREEFARREELRDRIESA